MNTTYRTTPNVHRVVLMHEDIDAIAKAVAKAQTRQAWKNLRNQGIAVSVLIAGASVYGYIKEQKEGKNLLKSVPDEEE